MLLFLEGFPSEKSSNSCVPPSQGTGGYVKHRHQCRLRSNLAARAPRFFFGGTRGLQAVQKLLQETRDKVQLVLQWDDMEIYPLVINWGNGKSPIFGMSFPYSKVYLQGVPASNVLISRWYIWYNSLSALFLMQPGSTTFFQAWFSN